MQQKAKKVVFHIAGHCSGLNLVMIIGILLLLLTGTCHAQGFDYEPFRSATELELRLPSDMGRNITGKDGLVLPAEFYRDRNPMNNEKMSVSDDNEENLLNLYVYRRIKLYMSRIETYGKDIDARRTTGTSKDKMGIVMMLPAMLSNDQYKDTFKSTGKILEPQLNLEIEF